MIPVNNSVQLRTSKLRNRRLLKLTQSKRTSFERDEPDVM